MKNGYRWVGNRLLAAVLGLAIIGGAVFVGHEIAQPERIAVTAASPQVLSVKQIVHSYADPSKDGTPVPVDCNGGKAFVRIVVDLEVTMAQGGLVPVSHDFGIMGTARGGGDIVAWNETPRQVHFPTGVSLMRFYADQRFTLGEGLPLPAGRYFFAVGMGRPGSKAFHRCEFIWG